MCCLELNDQLNELAVKANEVGREGSYIHNWHWKNSVTSKQPATEEVIARLAELRELTKRFDIEIMILIDRLVKEN